MICGARGRLRQSLGVPDHVRERCLNHLVGSMLGRVYGRFDFAAEKRDAWTRLGERLERMLGACAELPLRPTLAQS